MIKGILFDKDGTLIDFERTYGPGSISVIKALSNDKEELAKTLANAIDLDFETGRFDPGSVVIAGTGKQIAEAWHPYLPDWKIGDLIKEVDRLYTDMTEQHVTGFDDLEASMLAFQQMGIVLGVATNDAEESARRHIARLNHTRTFMFVAGYDSGYGAKPEPGMVSAFAAFNQVAPEEIMMVGDSTHDLHAGQSAGAVSVGVTTGMAGRPELAPHADHVVDSLDELVELVRANSK